MLNLARRPARPERFQFSIGDAQVPGRRGGVGVWRFNSLLEMPTLLARTIQGYAMQMFQFSIGDAVYSGECIKVQELGVSILYWRCTNPNPSSKPNRQAGDYRFQFSIGDAGRRR